MTLRVTPQARRHLDAVARYIHQRNPDAAVRVRMEIRETLRLLEQFPHCGRVGAATGTREAVVRRYPYIIVHRIEPNGDIVIVGVYHGAQLRPGHSD